jgi:thymidylate kinase
MNEHQAPDQPTLIIIRGLPGSGKSYLADALQQTLGQDRVVILDPDLIDFDSPQYKALCESLAAEGVDKIFFPNRFLKARGHEAISAHKIIIWNQAFTLLDGFHRTIANLQEYAAEHDIHLPVLLVEVEISPEVAKQRAAKRHAETGRQVSEERFNRFIDDYRSFSEEGFDTVTVSGEDDIATSAAAVIQALTQLGAK